MANHSLSQGAQAVPEIHAPSTSTQDIILKQSGEALEISDTLRFLAESTFNEVPGGVTVILQMLADKASAIGGILDRLHIAAPEVEA